MMLVVENASIYDLYNKTLSKIFNLLPMFVFCIHFVYFCISISFFQPVHVFAFYLNFNYSSRLNLVRFFVSIKRRSCTNH